MVETLPSNRADESLGVWVLPGTLRCSQNLVHTQGFDSQSDLSAVPAVSIAEERSGGIAIRKRLYDLLGSPVTGRMLGHIKVQQLAAIVFQDDEYEQHFHRDGRHGKEIGRDDLADMVVQEGLPCLVRRAAEPAQEARYGTLRDRDAEHFEFAMNPGCAPQRIGRGHLFD